MKLIFGSSNLQTHQQFCLNVSVVLHQHISKTSCCKNRNGFCIPTVAGRRTILKKLGLSCAKVTSSGFQAYSAEASHGISKQLIGGVQLKIISWTVFTKYTFFAFNTIKIKLQMADIWLNPFRYGLSNQRLGIVGGIPMLQLSHSYHKKYFPFQLEIAITQLKMRILNSLFFANILFW